VSIGDVAAAFDNAAYRRQETFAVHRHTGNPLETRGLVARYDAGTGELYVWGPTKVPHFNRTVLASFLNMPEAHIHFIEPDVGGGFGIRGEFYPEDFLIPFAAITLDALHRLRSLAHVIDMHQLTKDPTVLLDAHKTSVSPERTMTRFELTRYLDYCSEMLALIGKLAALYGERMRDSVVIDAVNDIENLTTGLGRKIWQKITIIEALDEAGPTAAA
jgi:hypothetical protein